eukprot:66249-Alexandrium_andersonii.AAC.1
MPRMTPRTAASKAAHSRGERARPWARRTRWSMRAAPQRRQRNVPSAPGSRMERSQSKHCACLLYTSDAADDM